jgi:hypothetical protein
MKIQTQGKEFPHRLTKKEREILESITWQDLIDWALSSVIRKKKK